MNWAIANVTSRAVPPRGPLETELSGLWDGETLAPPSLVTTSRLLRCCPTEGYSTERPEYFGTDWHGWSSRGSSNLKQDDLVTGG